MVHLNLLLKAPEVEHLAITIGVESIIHPRQVFIFRCTKYRSFRRMFSTPIAVTTTLKLGWIYGASYLLFASSGRYQDFGFQKSNAPSFDPRETMDVIDNLGATASGHDGCTLRKQRSPVLLTLEMVFHRGSPKERKSKHAI